MNLQSWFIIVAGAGNRPVQDFFDKSSGRVYLPRVT